MGAGDAQAIGTLDATAMASRARRPASSFLQRSHVVYTVMRSHAGVTHMRARRRLRLFFFFIRVIYLTNPRRLVEGAHDLSFDLVRPWCPTPIKAKGP
jgi:hypothetical protein